MAGDDQKRSGSRWLYFFGALCLGLPLLVICGLTLVGPPTWETGVVSLAVLIGVVSGLVAPWARPGAWGARAAFLLLFLVVVYRFFAAERSTSITSESDRWIDRIVPERDVAIGGSNLLISLGLAGMERDGAGLLDPLRDGYTRMREQEGAVPSAVISTVLFGLQSPESHSVFRVAPPSRFNPPEAVVLFLHGGMGPVTLECWQVAQAANPVGVDVLCPSADARARWASEPHRRTVEQSIEQLRAQGVQRVYLAGLSAGAIGASRLAGHLDVEGVILISGASRQARPARVPTIVIQGRDDPRCPPGPARAYARSLGRRARYVEHPEADHWLILSHHEWVTEHLREWIAEQEGLGEIQ